MPLRAAPHSHPRMLRLSLSAHIFPGQNRFERASYPYPSPLWSELSDHSSGQSDDLRHIAVQGQWLFGIDYVRFQNPWREAHESPDPYRPSETKCLHQDALPCS